jgi:hypothetical protein
MKKPKEPPVRFEFICEWFEKAINNAQKMGRQESALLWKDGLSYLKYFHALVVKKEAELAAARDVLRFILEDTGDEFDCPRCHAACRKALKEAE